MCLLFSRLFSALLAHWPQLVNAPVDEGDTTLLHVAAANLSAPAILRELLSLGANVQGQDSDGLSALHVAAMWGNGAGVRQLLQHGADPLLTDVEDMTPVDHALGQGE